MESAHVIDGFAVEDAFEEEILLSIGDGARIGIGAAGIGEDSGEARGRGAGQSDADARLNNGVALTANAGGGVDFDFVEWMGDGLDQQAAGVGRQLRVGIERDDV